MLSLSYLAGVLTLLPAGIGSREAAMLALGGWLHVNIETTATLAIVSRLAMVAVDMVTASFGLTRLLLLRRR
jgi:uncharacterized membrane protein YbhN (UPF0104 family)